MPDNSKLVSSIKNNRCILFLGPLLRNCLTSVSNNGKKRNAKIAFTNIITQTLIQNLSGNIDQGADQLNYSYFPQYIMERYIDENSRDDLKQIVSNITDAAKPSNVYTLLARLPFNTIVNFGSDLMMNKAFSQLGYDYNFFYFDRNGEPKRYLDGLNDKTPLLYNLLGTTDDFDSQFLTESDDVDFLKQISETPSPLPDSLISRFKPVNNNDKTFLFLGFNFEQWQFRFLMEILEIPNSKQQLSMVPAQPGFIAYTFTKQFYNNKFGFTFIEDNTETFIVSLIKDYRKKNNLTNLVQKIFIAFHDADKDVVDGFKKQYSISGLAKRSELKNKTDVQPGDEVTKAIDSMYAAANIYIAVLSADFLADDILNAQLQNAINTSKTIIVIIAKTCSYQFSYPTIRNKALILPAADHAMKEAGKIPIDDDYMNIVVKINTFLR